VSVDRIPQCIARLSAAWKRSDELFGLIPEGVLLERPIGLRHPFLFYVGHLPAFAWNQVGRGALQAGHLDKHFDILFERGIDPADVEGAARQSIAVWPSFAEVLAYRDEVRRAVIDRMGDIFSRGGDVL